jgi:cytochrome c553
MDLRSCKTILVKGLQLGFALSLVAGIAPMKAFAVDAAAPADAAPADAAVAPAEVAAPAETGDAAIGKMYFTGEKRFESGAPACMSCHSVSYGSLNGGVLGPNLTKVYADESKNPLLSAAWINGGSPVMAPIFGAKNVTDEEVSHLRAFFAEQSKGEVASSQTGTFTIIGLGGFVGILIVFNIIWSGRYRNRNKGTAHDALWRNYGGKGGR